MSSDTIAQRIREGNQKRHEQQRKQHQLQQEYEAELREQMEAEKKRGPAQYLPYILMFLMFVSLPLSEQVVDWLLVSLFCLLNGTATLVLSRPSAWMNMALVFLLNLLLVRWSPFLYDIPAAVARVSPATLAAYIVGDVIFAAVLYFAYVLRRVPFSGPRAPPQQARRQSLKRAKSSGARGELEEFARRKECLDRLDLALTGWIVANFAALIYIGVVPLELVLQSFRNILHVLR